MTHRFYTSTALGLLLAGPFSMGAVSFAQEGQTSAQNATNDEIVVTGSRIRRSNIYTAIPVQGLDIADIESSGTADLAELITQIPGVEFSLSPESTNLSTQNRGLSTINLRGLGGDRTLVLINSRRAVSNSGNGERVSLDTIPSGFVQRVEVTTGGASAIYGADAIAGVANVILRDGFEGVRAGYRFSSADASGERENTVDLTIGKNFAGDRGNVLLGVTYDNETAVFADATRPDSITPFRFNPDPDCVPERFTECDRDLSSFLPGGRFEGDDAWNIGGVWFNDQSLVPDDGRISAGFETDRDGFNLRTGRTLSPDVETLALAGNLDYDLTNNISAFAEVYYTDVGTSSLAGIGRTASSGTDIGPAGNSIDIGTISSSNPFIPAEVEETRIGSVSWARRFTEVGPRLTENDRTTLRTAAGFEGSLANDWAWTAYGTYGRFEQEQVQFNELNFQNIRNALRVESDGAGGFQCDDADARADGCVPLNIFGEGSISTAAADYIRVTGNLRQEREQIIGAANINGDVFELPAGALKAAFGVEYRKESQTTVGDPDNVLELTSLSVIPDIDASFDVIEGFGELDVPLIKDQPGVHSLDLQLAGRVGNYSTIGTIVSYNIGGSYSPNPDMRFRAQYSRSQRAPTITEFFSLARGDFDNLADPCDGLNPDGTGLTGPNATIFAANCLTEVGIQAFFANPDNAGSPFDANDGSVFGPNAGNNQLNEETADTFTIGLILAPEAFSNFSIIIDYYHINIEGAIGTVSTQDTADLCYAATVFPNNRFCDVITRDASTGEVVEVINREENLNSRLAEGIDFTLNYDFDPKIIPGDFDFKIVYALSLSNERVFEGLNGPEFADFNGEIGDPIDRFRARLGWNWNDFRFSYVWNYQSGGVDDNEISVSDNAFFETGSQSFHDIYAQYGFDNKFNTQIFGGVRNLLNDFGPVVPTNLPNGSGNTRNIVSNVNSPIGREFYIGVRANW